MTTSTTQRHGLGRYKSRTNPCNCGICREANLTYQRSRDRLIAYGRWDPFVDVAPVVAHLRTLMAQGMGLQRIARTAGVSDNALSAAVWGKAGHHTQQMSHRVAEAVLAVQLDLADGTQIPAAGTIRRARALMVIGWSISGQARHTGETHSAYRQRLYNDKVTVASARTVAELFDRLRDTPYDGPGAVKTRRYAARMGFAGPDRWTDETIDDPAAEPIPADRVPDDELVRRVLAGNARTLDGRPLRITDVDRDEVIRRLLLQGRPGAAGRLLNVSGATAKALVEQVVHTACLTELAESEAS